jgi:hypothetical protein
MTTAEINNIDWNKINGGNLSGFKSNNWYWVQFEKERMLLFSYQTFQFNQLLNIII